MGLPLLYRSSPSDVGRSISALGSHPAEGSPSVHEEFRADRVLCEDGFCLGVMRVADDGAPYRGVPEVVCPICGRRASRSTVRLTPRRRP